MLRKSVRITFHTKSEKTNQKFHKKARFFFGQISQNILQRILADVMKRISKKELQTPRKPSLLQDICKSFEKFVVFFFRNFLKFLKLRSDALDRLYRSE